MKSTSLSNLTFNYLLFVLTISPAAMAQVIENPAEYLGKLNEKQVEILNDYMKYTSAVAHGKSARKVENLRKELIKTVSEARKAVLTMPPYKSDKSLRDSTANFLQMTYAILNDDYDKIIDLEEVMEQSYDAMEAYFTAQEKATEKLNNANENLVKETKAFAGRNNIQLIEKEDALEKKVVITGKVNKHYNQVFLIQFKCSNQEKYLIDAMNKKDINAMEQNRSVLQKYTEESLKKLDTLKSYNNDRSLINTCRQILLFYQDECKTQMPKLLDFYVKEDNFTKIQKAFDTKPENLRTQEDVNKFNAMVKEVNAAATNFNSINKNLNQKRNTLNQHWNNTIKTFLDKHVPKY